MDEIIEEVVEVKEVEEAPKPKKKAAPPEADFVLTEANSPRMIDNDFHRLHSKFETVRVDVVDAGSAARNSALMTVAILAAKAGGTIYVKKSFSKNFPGLKFSRAADGYVAYSKDG